MAGQLAANDAPAAALGPPATGVTAGGCGVTLAPTPYRSGICTPAGIAGIVGGLGGGASAAGITGAVGAPAAAGVPTGFPYRSAADGADGVSDIGPVVAASPFGPGLRILLVVPAAVEFG